MAPRALPVTSTSWSARLGDLDVQFIGQTEFLKNKKAAGREKDLADIDALRPKGPR